MNLSNKMNLIVILTIIILIAMNILTLFMGINELNSPYCIKPLSILQIIMGSVGLVLTILSCIITFIEEAAL